MRGNPTSCAGGLHARCMCPSPSHTLQNVHVQQAQQHASSGGSGADRSGFSICSFVARGSRLIVLRGQPEEVLPRVLKVSAVSQRVNTSIDGSLCCRIGLAARQ
jgi:hypothetical protein